MLTIYNWSSYVYILELPKRCLIENTNDLRSYSFNGYYKEYFKKVVQVLINQDSNDYLQKFINTDKFKSLPSWKQEIISKPKLLSEKCASRMIAVSDDEQVCYLLNVGKPRDKRSTYKL